MQAECESLYVCECDVTDGRRLPSPNVQYQKIVAAKKSSWKKIAELPCAESSVRPRLRRGRPLTRTDTFSEGEENGEERRRMKEEWMAN